MTLKFIVGDKVVTSASYRKRFPKEAVGPFKVTEAGRLDSTWPYALSDGSIMSEDELELQPKRDYVGDHARRTLRKAGLSAKDAAAWVVNTRTGFADWLKEWPEANAMKGYADAEALLSAMSRKLPVPLKAMLGDGFAWGNSPEGQAHWNVLYDSAVRK